MDNSALIQEAREFSAGWGANGRDIGSAMELIDRLAAALEEMELPEGWRWTEAMREDGATANQAGPDWGAFRSDGVMVDVYTTSREAMAALGDATHPA
jgi:hypothetical protein